MKCRNNNDYRWRPLGPEQEAFLREVLESWVGTPYFSHGRARGTGCDCVGFVAGVLDTMYGIKSEIPHLPGDVATHDVITAYKTVHAMVEAYRPTICRSRVLEPGDVLVVRNTMQPAARNPGHVMIVGTRPWQAYHAIGDSGVCRTSCFENSGIMRIYRPERKASWLSPLAI